MPALTPRNAAIGAGAVIGAAMIFPRSISKVAPENPFETPAVKSVGDRYTAQGGTPTHTPGVATPLGNPDNIGANVDKLKGPSTKHFRENHSDQKVNGPITDASAKFMKAQTGDEKGK